jgi:hypothetical protein
MIGHHGSKHGLLNPNGHLGFASSNHDLGSCLGHVLDKGLLDGIKEVGYGINAINVTSCEIHQCLRTRNIIGNKLKTWCEHTKKNVKTQPPPSFPKLNPP